MKKHLDFPDELAAFLEAEAAKNYRSFSAEVIARCVGFGTFLDARIVQIGLNPNTSETIVGSSSFNPETSESEASSLRERVQMVDMLLNDGDPKRPNSNFQRRRRRQLAALKDAWSAFFPDETPVLDKNLKQWLALRNNYAEDVFDCFEEVSRRNVKGAGLVSYVSKVVADVPKSDITGVMRVEPQSKPYTTPDSWKITPMTDADRAEMRRGREIALKNGWLTPDMLQDYKDGA